MNGWMQAVSSVQLLRPWWLLALALLPALALAARYRTRRRTAWQRAIDAHLLPHVMEPAPSRHTATAVLPMLGLALLAVALAGPSVGREPLPLWQARQPLVVALDLSTTMLADDVQPSRLARARRKVADLLAMRQGGDVALVVFADDAFTVAPLTSDVANIALYLDALSPQVMPADGQRADRAIAWSQRLLRQAGADGGQILVITDHADAAATAAAAQAKADGVEVDVLGVGAAPGDVHGASGGALAGLDAPSLRRLAAAGGGRYATLASGDDDLAGLGVLDTRAGGGRVDGQGSAWRDDGAWLLLPAMLCLLPLFRRGGGLAVLLVVAFLPLPGLRAQPPAQVPGGTLWQRADQRQAAQAGAAVTAYRAGRYEDAAAAFARQPGALGQYNLGNALARLGRLDDAVAAYDRALALDPALADARFNRDVVDAARNQRPSPPPPASEGAPPRQQDGSGQGAPPKTQEPSAGQGGQGQQDRNGAPQARSQPGNAPDAGRNEPTSGSPPPPSRQAAASAQQGAGQRRAEPATHGAAGERQPDGGSGGAAGATPADPRKQRRADDAQRQRMQDARGTSAAPQPGRAVATDPQARERQLANEAMLQRIEDDPGALLRARFELEARRRRDASR